MPNPTIKQVLQAYGVAEGDGEGECIGIISLDGGYDLAQVKKFCKVEKPHIVDVSVLGATNAPLRAIGGPIASFETTQDIAIAAAVAPAAKIAVYIAPASSAPQALLSAVAKAVEDEENKPSVLCICYAFPEGIWSSVWKRVEAEFTAARKRNITVISATGDLGQGARYPASSPQVLACGGLNSRLNKPKTTTKGKRVPVSLRETKWADGGFGVSEIFRRPAYQAKARTSAAGRNVPDAAGYAFQGYAGRVGTHRSLFGTSAVAPFWAGCIARYNSRNNTRIGFVNELLYAQHGLTFNQQMGLASKGLRLLLGYQSGR